LERGYSGLLGVRDHLQQTESSMDWRNDGVLAWHEVCVRERGQEREGEVSHGMATVIYINREPHSPVTTLPVSPLVGFLLFAVFQGFPASSLLLIPFSY
jgi:hypothetical protein